MTLRTPTSRFLSYVDAIAEALVLGLKAGDSLLVFATLVGMAGLKGLSHPGEYFIVEAQPPQQLGEPGLQDFFAHVFAPAQRGLAPTLFGMAGAMVIDVALFLDLAHDRTPALGARDQPRKRKIVLHAAMLLGVSASQNALNAFPPIAAD
jgi:hypothetical protein